MKSIEFYKEEFFLEDYEMDSFKKFINENNQKVFYSRYSKITKKEDGELFGICFIPPKRRDDFKKKEFPSMYDSF